MTSTAVPTIFFFSTVKQPAQRRQVRRANEVSGNGSESVADGIDNSAVCVNVCDSVSSVVCESVGEDVIGSIPVRHLLLL